LFLCRTTAGFGGVMPPLWQQPAVQLSNQFEALNLSRDPHSTPQHAAQQAAAGATAPQYSAAPATPGGPFNGFFSISTHAIQQQMGQLYLNQHQQPQAMPAVPVVPPADVQAACQSRRQLEVLLQQDDSSMFSQHERKEVMAYLREELLSGYAGGCWP
jgi:hypothetical protein